MDDRARIAPVRREDAAVEGELEQAVALHRVARRAARFRPGRIAERPELADVAAQRTLARTQRAGGLDDVEALLDPRGKLLAGATTDRFERPRQQPAGAFA